MSGQQYALPALRQLGFIQLRIEPGKIDANLRRLRENLKHLSPPPHTLIVLPELWATGFAYSELTALQERVAILSEELRELSERFDILFAGSLPEQVGGKENLFYNTLKIIGGEGIFGAYRKRNLFPGEEQSFASWPGPTQPVVTSWGKCGCLVCYDLRFPDLAREQCQQGADLLLCSAEWPLARIAHWRALIVARAIENQTFMVACNGVGENGGLVLGGHSLVVSPSGEILYEAGEDEEGKVVTIDWRMKNDALAAFKSFAVSPYGFSEGKIATAADCVADAEIRTGIGQRVVWVALEKGIEYTRAIENLEAARRQGDYLVVGVSQPMEHGFASASSERGLLPYAALGCVDAVFSLDELSTEDKRRLREICLIFEI